MEIPDTEIYEIGVGILSFIGVVVGILLKVLIDEIKHLRNSLDRVEKHLSQAKEEIIRVTTVVAACKSCPHPNLNGIGKTETIEEELE
jgi:hypothetical protein